MQCLAEFALSQIGYVESKRPREAISNVRCTVARHIQNQKNKVKYSREAKVRRIVEALTRSKWPSVRPDWLINTTGSRLELDLYNAQHNCGIEVQGDQHVRFVPWFHKTYDEYLRMRSRDALKAAICRKRKVKLIYVPSKRLLPDEELELYLITRLKE